ncbi:hypothetical protein J4427_01070 [Candidatus Woesearchaeota archaeon]|nr:hypothetical protein [uncultured archaeon]MBS3163262.1 hypothetical protein [Candidatus Woesearchaeota archaeon]
MLETLALLGTGFLALIIVLSIWEAIWKGFGMWRSARNGHLVWFVCILVLNTIGILPIIYLLLHPKKKRK